MPGLELIGPIAGTVQVPSSDPAVEAQESMGLFVAGDASTIRSYSGAELGWRWLARAQGPLVKNVKGWPEGPEGGTVGYFRTEEEARAYYSALRQHALTSTPGLVAQDTRQNFPLNVPTAYAESFWQYGSEVLRLIYDRMADMQVYARNTDAIAVFDASPRSAPAPDGGAHPSKIVSYYSQNQVLYLAVARGASGGAEHVVIVFSDQHKPHPVIPDGLPRAEWMRTLVSGPADASGERAKLQLAFPSNVLVVQWGRLSGLDLLAQEDRTNPLSTLLPRLQSAVAVPLAAPQGIAPRLGGVPAGYAIRLEPGAYTVTYYELMGTPTGGYSCCAISREGAPSFMPAVLGNAGGIIHGGLTVEQYAMLSVERDNLFMRQGPLALASPDMIALCQKYGLAWEPSGRAGRVDGWELMIQGDASFSAQWALQRGIATMRLQGVEPTREQIDAMGKQQLAATAAVEAHHKNFVAKRKSTREAALEIIAFALGKTPDKVVAECRRIAADLRPDDVLFDTMRILRKPGKDGNPKFDNVDKRLDVLVKARWSAMDEEKRRFEGGTVEKFLKSEMDDIYPPNDLKLPGLMGWLSRI